jgi:hypothetical protein
MFIPGEQWWLEEILAEEGLTPGFILIHSDKGRDVACRIPPWESEDELRQKLAGMIVELRELIQQPTIWLKT